MTQLLIFGFIFLGAIVADMVCRPHHVIEFKRRTVRAEFKPQRGSRRHHNDL